MNKLKALILCLSISFCINAQKGNYNFLVGTYTNGTTAKGIYSLHLDFKNKHYYAVLRADGVINPSYLVLSKDKKKVYAVNENAKNSHLTAFEFHKNTGDLFFINKTYKVGEDPCFIDISSKHVSIANYSSGDIGVYERKSDGSLGELVQRIQHTGNGINAARQDKSHVHQTIFTSDKKHMLATNLGSDSLILYSYLAKNTENTMNQVDGLKLKPGSGPRHLTFSEKSKYIYLLQELDGTVSVIRMHKAKLFLQNEYSIVREQNVEIGAADIHISPDGKFLYATNRGSANNITCFAIQKNGELIFIQQTSTLGRGPRNFTITRDGKYVIVGNQYSNEVVVFNRNSRSGVLTDSGIRISIGAPVCIKEY